MAAVTTGRARFPLPAAMIGGSVMKFAPLSLADFKTFKARSGPVKLAYHSLADPKYDNLFDKTIRDKFFKKYNDMDFCADTLFYKEFDDGSNEFYHAIFCQDKFCPLCQEILYRKNLKQLSDILIKIKDNKGCAFGPEFHKCGFSKDIKYIFGTLTIPNCSGFDLKDRIKFLGDSWIKLRKRLDRLDLPDPDPVSGYSNMFLGFYAILEVTYKYRWIEDGSKLVRRLEFHPHLHFIAAVPSGYSQRQKRYKEGDNIYVYYPYQLSQALLSAMWGDITGQIHDISKEPSYSGVFKRIIADPRCRGFVSDTVFPCGVVSLESTNKSLKDLSREAVKQRKFDLMKDICDDDMLADYVSKGICKLHYLDKDPIPLGYLSVGLAGVRIFRPSGVFREELKRYKQASDSEAAAGFSGSDLSEDLRHFIMLCYKYNHVSKDYDLQD